MTVPLEMWGGVECSVVRIGDRTRNQLLETGHYQRAHDLELIAGLGIRTLRYPVLWEMVEPTAGGYDWTWVDRRLHRLRELGIRPVVGLLHHGNGPAWIDLLHQDFPRRFSEFAARVAQRYPWVDMFTPINEPQTTARISGLYGLWHPHGRDEATFLHLTVAQCRSIALAMDAIRQHTPGALLVQTEDVGRVFANPRLAYQADYENQRRWLALDLLTGRVDGGHLLHKRMRDAGIGDDLLAKLAAAPCPPDIIGIDYYLTSDRMLDDRLERYPLEHPGGNGFDVYADIAAVRSDRREESGLGSRIAETWDRYHLPIAVTELHNGSTRDEQLRWLIEGWTGARAAKDCGIDVRAVTSWSLFGAVDWNTMLLNRDHYYESGAFDIRGGGPRPTAIAAAIASLVRQEALDHPALDRSGWWRSEPMPRAAARTILLNGWGRLASVIEACCASRRLAVRQASPEQLLSPTALHGAWASIVIDEGATSHRTGRLKCTYSDLSHMTLRFSTALPSVAVANAFLDLMVDGGRGIFELKRAGLHNQYEVVQLAAEPTGGEVVRDGYSHVA
ncbi:family 1 glycosylhydrolase [Mesorhizobium loti]|uniref:family 1 glycosylhydrolase n=1 Tax=Rhizobium loti TaxID=381 RepID=UPI000415EDD8|nr:family 1 glycosylhydrolase [Mesorhizobium loti]